MKIIPYKNNPNFTSKLMHGLKLYNNNDYPISAAFSQLDPFNDQDKKAMQTVHKTWIKYSSVPKFLCNDFFAPAGEQFYAIEQSGKRDLSERIIGLAEITLFPSSEENLRNLSLSNIAVKPEFSYKEKETREIKNIGECLFEEIIKLAQKLKCSYLQFYSSNDDFYHKILENAGLKEQEYSALSTSKSKLSTTEFVIPKSSFYKIMSYSQKKFGLLLCDLKNYKI